MNMPATSRLYLVVFSRVLIGAVLFTAGALKLRAPSSFFTAVVAGFQLLPRKFHRPVAFALPTVECLVGGLLLAAIVLPDRLMRWASVPASMLFVIFASAVAINLLRGRRDVSCGCFGVREDEKISWGLVGRNICLSALAALALPSCSAATVPEAAYRKTDAMFLGSSVLIMWFLLRAIVRMRRYGQGSEV
jgi:hypothetical protein